jgi:hypothetical protein
MDPGRFLGVVGSPNDACSRGLLKHRDRNERGPSHVRVPAPLGTERDPLLYIRNAFKSYELYANGSIIAANGVTGVAKAESFP